MKSRVTGPVAKRAVFDGRQAIVTSGVSAASGTPMTLIEAAPVHGTRTGTAINDRYATGGAAAAA